MSKNYELTVYIFRRDLRVYDNTGLNFALENSNQVLPCFIFDPAQVKAHAYQSSAGLQFLMQSLNSLTTELAEIGGRLYQFFGRPSEVLANLLAEKKYNAIIFNRDYTPFSRKRDLEIKAFADSKGVTTHQIADTLLLEPESGLKLDGLPYTVFTPFFKKNAAKRIKSPQSVSSRNYFTQDLKCAWPGDRESLLINPKPMLCLRGGRENALKLLDDLGTKSDYSAKRDFPSLAGTSLLSAHHKFGTCSIRETYWAIVERLGPGHDLIRQLYWRDFFYHVAFNFPHVFGSAFKRQYDRLDWSNDAQKFEAWCNARTGFPIVDAGIQELISTGYMHNRVRMIVASFLTKDLHCDWRWGERFFAQHLVDYDPAVNNGNWQWAASTGCDAVPYFRIFNPWLQQAKFDPEASYIKRWLPELARIPSRILHAWNEVEQSGIPNYPRPIVDHQEAKLRTQEMFEQVNEL